MIVWFTGFICTSHDTLAWDITARFSAKVHTEKPGGGGGNAKKTARKNKHFLENTYNKSFQGKKTNTSPSPTIQRSNAEVHCQRN